MATYSVHLRCFIYRVDDPSEGLESSQHRKHMLDCVCNGGQLGARDVEKEREVERER